MAQLTERGARLHVAWRDTPTRRAVTLLEEDGERTIITIGERLEPSGDDALPWERLADCAGVYLTAGDAGALARSCDAGVLVASPRARTSLESPGPMIDAIVFSEHDPDESAWAERTASRARLLVATEGAQGGRWWGESTGGGRRCRSPDRHATPTDAVTRSPAGSCSGWRGVSRWRTRRRSARSWARAHS